MPDKDDGQNTPPNNGKPEQKGREPVLIRREVLDSLPEETRQTIIEGSERLLIPREALDSLPEEARQAIIEGSEPLLVAPEILDDLPEEARKTIIMSTSASFSGPLPPPRMLRAYDEVLPGMADRIVTLTERQTDHRISTESILAKASVRSWTIGQYLGFSYSIGALVGTAYVAVNGNTAIAILILSTGVAGIARDLIRSLLSRRDAEEDSE